MRRRKPKKAALQQYPDQMEARLSTPQQSLGTSGGFSLRVGVSSVDLAIAFALLPIALYGQRKEGEILIGIYCISYIVIVGDLICKAFAATCGFLAVQSDTRGGM